MQIFGIPIISFLPHVAVFRFTPRSVCRDNPKKGCVVPGGGQEFEERRKRGRRSIIPPPPDFVLVSASAGKGTGRQSPVEFRPSFQFASTFIAHVGRKAAFLPSLLLSFLPLMEVLSSVLNHAAGPAAAAAADESSAAARTKSYDLEAEKVDSPLVWRASVDSPAKGFLSDAHER